MPPSCPAPRGCPILGPHSWAPDQAEHLKVPCASRSGSLPAHGIGSCGLTPRGCACLWHPSHPGGNGRWPRQDLGLAWSALARPSLPAACSAPRQRLRNSERRKRQPHVEPLVAAPRVTASPAGRASFPSGSREGKLPQQSAHQQKGCGCRRDTQLPFGSAPEELGKNCARRVE